MERTRLMFCLSLSSGLSVLAFVCSSIVAEDQTLEMIEKELGKTDSLQN
jgi:hypothetical protein